MKLFTTIQNTRGGKKNMSDDTRILIELSYKNKTLGTLGLYTIENHPDGSDLGYRLVWRSNTTPSTGQILEEVESTHRSHGITHGEQDVNNFLSKGEKLKSENKCGHPNCAEEICIDDIPF